MMLCPLVISVCLGLSTPVYSTVDFAPLETKASTTKETTELTSSTICSRCTCIQREIVCRGRPKLMDLANLQIPANYNKLVLSSNQLTRLHPDSFKSGIDLTEIDLTYNEIGFIAGNSFQPFKNLTTLCLAHNNLVTLEDDSFAGLEKLQKLDISHNRFKILNPAYFEKLVNLQFLILDSNALVHLHGSIFKNNIKLTHLFMNKISASQLEDDIFQYTRNLRVLHLEDNFLEDVPRKALAKLPLLEVLYLSGNPIHVISAMAFPKLPNLQTLVLDGMYNLGLIDIYGFTDLPLLRNLKIQHCTNLVYIDPQAFNLDIQKEHSRYPQLKHFVLHDTSVTTLSEKLLNWDDLEDLDISGNHFHCNCNLSWIIDVVRKNDVNNNIKCHSPEALADRVIGRIQPKEMICDNYHPMKDDGESAPYHERAPVIPESRRFSLLHLSVIVMLSVTIALSVLLVLSIRRRGFIYRKLGGKPAPMTYAGGENVLYMRTTIDC
ncbi:leucine-rich repeat neuronal protein 2 [Galendromus occidentalis]|uniref:Leucine-rich repeat neuronal protein 2 n=1 Tax=Galendromus occidentalis TaxID=34638 RepID=A0AAJ7L5S7_9ACAR|nr:leucine-rich repeat neuronal protein 2 [Galendromus occidentalis]